MALFYMAVKSYLQSVTLQLKEERKVSGLLGPVFRCIQYINKCICMYIYILIFKN